MYRSLITFIFMLTIIHLAGAQDKRLDSIIHSTQHDTLKVIALADIGAELAMKADAGVIAVADKGIALAVGKEKLPNYRNWLSRFYVEKGVYYQFTGKYDEAKSWFQKGLELGERYNDGKVITRSLANLGNIANYQGDYRLAADYGLKVLEISEREGDANNIAGALGNLANTYIRLNLYDRALRLLQRAVPLAVKSADKRLEANLYNSMATAYGEQKKQQPEFDYTLKAYRLYKELKNPKGIGTTALNLGMVYERRKAYGEALSYLQESIVPGSLSIDFDADDSARQHNFSPENQLSIYRIVQEVLSNMLRHSGASNINIRITEDKGTFVFLIEDNGQGFEANAIARSAGIGWKNIGARVRLLDGQLRVRSGKLTGTRISIMLPS